MGQFQSLPNKVRSSLGVGIVKIRHGSNFTYIKDKMLDYFHYWKFMLFPQRSYLIYHAMPHDTRILWFRGGDLNDIKIFGHFLFVGIGTFPYNLDIYTI